jgi:hypothetical protein
MCKLAPTKSEWNETDPINPIFCFGCRPDQQQIVDRCTDIQVLGNDDQAWTGTAPPKSDEMRWHGLAVMRNEDP